MCSRRSPQVPAAWGATCLWSQGTGSDLSLSKGGEINCREKLIRVKEERLLKTKGDCLDEGCILFAGSFFLFPFCPKLCVQTDLPKHFFLCLSPSLSKYGEGVSGIRTKLADHCTFGTKGLKIRARLSESFQ